MRFWIDVENASGAREGAGAGTIGSATFDFWDAWE